MAYSRKSKSREPKYYVPWEIIFMVLSFCNPDIATWKTFRLVSKSFCDVATPHVFEEAHMGMFEDSLLKVEAISEHEELRTFIKRYILHSETLPRYASEPKWREVISYGGGLTKKEYKEAYRQYNLIVQQQKAFTVSSDYDSFKKGFDLSDRLSRALQRMPNLAETELASITPTQIEQGVIPPPWRGLASKILQSPLDWTQALDSERDYVPHKAYDQICLLTAALSVWKSPHRPESFKLSIPVFIGHAPLSMKSGGARLFPQIFRNIKRMELDTGYLPCSRLSTDEIRDVDESIVGILHECRSLNELTLRMDATETDRFEYRNYLMDYLGWERFPYLHTLTLGGFATTENSIWWSLQNLTNLKHLRLENMHLMPGNWDDKPNTWVSVFDWIWHALSLETFSFSGLRDHTRDSEFSDAAKRLIVRHVLHALPCGELEYEDFVAMVESEEAVSATSLI